MSRTVIHLPAVALRGMTILPGMVAHFDISRDRSIHAIEEAMVGDQKIFLITQQDASVEEPARDDLYQIGVIAEVKQVIKMPNEIVRVLVEGLERGELASFLSQEKYLMAEVILFDEKTAEEEELMPEAKEAMLRCIRETVLKYQKANGHMSKEFLRQVEEQQDVGTLMQQVAYNLPLYYIQKQKILEAVDLTSQYETLMAILLNEVEVISLKNEFQAKVKERVDKNQKEYLLREQMKLIREELGEDNTQSDAEHFLEEVKKLKADKTVKERIKKEIERFKNINDIHGIAEGDQVLRFVARVLQETYGNQNNYARLHSDMFVFYMSYDKKGEIIKEIEKLRKKISNNPFQYDIVTKFGIYLVNDRSIPVNLMCDRAMMAERTVKGNIMKFCAFYDEHYREEMLRAGQIEQDMEKALTEHQYQMYLQPKYRLKDNSLCGAEVLCRWQHPEKGLIPPNDFIPLFEKNGFILKLDEYMWEEACKNIRRWLDQGRSVVPISVNISRYHIQHNDLEKALMELIHKYDLTPDMLNLEITESLFLDKPEELNRVLDRLQKLGFKLEVDDFGSGFSSLNLIRNISVDTIKIDKEFLDSEIASEKGKIVVNHTIGMAKDLHLQVIAEGVETKAHVDFLKNSNCDIAQGFYFAKPMPVPEFERIAF